MFDLAFLMMGLGLLLLLGLFAWHFFGNSLAIQVWWVNLGWAIERWRSTWPLHVARRMPKWLVYWCVIRAIAHATSGRYSNEVVSDTSAMDVLKRWDEQRPEDRA